MLYDDVISGLRSKGMTPNEILQVLTAIASIPHAALPVTPTIAIGTLTLYIKYGGQRKLHYLCIPRSHIQNLGVTKPWRESPRL